MLTPEGNRVLVDALIEREHRRILVEHCCRKKHRRGTVHLVEEVVQRNFWLTATAAAAKQREKQQWDEQISSHAR